MAESLKEASEKREHILQRQNWLGLFSIGKQISFQGLSESNCSITSDGTYIYLYISVVQRGGLYKVGTGENGTTAGKVYLQATADREGEVNWVYCQGKLYSRRANEPLSQVFIYDPETLKSEGKVKLYAKDILNSSESASVNKFAPLLTDGNNLFLVTMKVTEKTRKIKNSMADAYVEFKRKRTLQDEEAARKRARRRLEKESELQKAEAILEKEIVEKKKKL